MKIKLSLFLILLSFLGSYVVMSVIYPELFISRNVSFIRFGDTEHNFYGVFTLVSNFFNGGIQLWNPYDQMPLTFYYLMGGLTSFVNFVTGVFYVLLSPIFFSPGEAFHIVYSIVFYSTIIIILSLGWFLLLRRFTKSLVVLTVSTVLGSSLYMPHLFMGVSIATMYCFIPLTMHFILKLFERFKLSNLLLIILLFGAFVSMDPLAALGYFYQGLHFFLISAFVWMVVTKKLWKINRLNKNWNIKSGEIVRKSLKTLTVILLVLFMVSPWVYLLKESYNTYDFAHESSRFARINPLDFSSYFKRGSQNIPQNEFFWRIISFDKNYWQLSWLFLGYSAVFLALSGLILSKDSKRFIFLITIILYYLINSPKTVSGLSGLAHWINAITNPLNFIVRSFHMVGAFILPFVIVPLITLGIEGLTEFAKEVKDCSKLVRGAILTSLLIIFVYLALPNLSSEIKNYLGFGLSLSFFLFLFISLKKIPSKIKLFFIASILGILIFVDIFAMRRYIKFVAEQMLIKEHSLTDDSAYLLDYQNPKILPFRSFYRASYQPQLSGFLYTNPNNMQGLFYRYTNINKYFEEESIYRPRHKSYTSLRRIDKLQEYLKRENRLIYRADIADNEIKEGNTPLIESKIENLTFDLEKTKKARENNLLYVFIDLPDNFPSYWSTGVFTKDRELFAVSIDNKKLTPVQGKPTSPFTFDLGNYKSRVLTVVLPVDYKTNSQVSFAYPKPEIDEIVNVWKNEPDNLGFDFNAAKDGWLVIHYPYDEKWKVLLNNIEVKSHRVNYSFLGIPIKSGINKILLSYWPNPILRLLMAASMFLIISLPVAIIVVEIKRESG